MMSSYTWPTAEPLYLKQITDITSDMQHIRVMYYGIIDRTPSSCAMCKSEHNNNIRHNDCALCFKCINKLRKDVYDMSHINNTYMKFAAYYSKIREANNEFNIGDDDNDNDDNDGVDHDMIDTTKASEYGDIFKTAFESIGMPAEFGKLVKTEMTKQIKILNQINDFEIYCRDLRAMGNVSINDITQYGNYICMSNDDHVINADYEAYLHMLYGIEWVKQHKTAEYWQHCDHADVMAIDGNIRKELNISIQRSRYVGCIVCASPVITGLMFDYNALCMKCAHKHMN